MWWIYIIIYICAFICMVNTMLNLNIFTKLLEQKLIYGQADRDTCYFFWLSRSLVENKQVNLIFFVYFFWKNNYYVFLAGSCLRNPMLAEVE